MTPSDDDTAAELARVEREPLLAAEKWLVFGSLAVGVGLLIILSLVLRP